MYILVNIIAKPLTIIVASLYRSVANAYAMLLSFVNGTNDAAGLGNIFVEAESISSKLYVLIGVFMLFRLAISLINYLINPDQIDDKQVGGGKLVTRIIVSVVLLISLQTFVFDFLGDLQDALLDPNNFLNTLFEDQSIVVNSNTGNVSEELTYENRIDNFKFSNPLIVDVYAKDDNDDGMVSFDCYYISSVGSLFSSDPIQYGESWVRLTISNRSFADAIQIKQGITDKISLDWWVKNNSDSFSIGEGAYRTSELSFSKAKVINNVFEKSIEKARLNQKKCPQYIDMAGDVLQFKMDGSLPPYDYIGGYLTPSEGVETMIQAAIKDGEKNSTVEIKDDYVQEEIEKAIASYGTIDPNAIVWARGIVKLFAEPQGALKDFLNDAETDSDIAKNAEQEDFRMDFFLAIIVGIALIVFLWVLCIEVIVRNLKLMLLQIIAPIPVICYMNPNDKIFNAWVKMYVGTYIDLFLKLLAIKAGIWFMNTYMDSLSGVNFLWKLLIIAGSLMFIKALPNMLSKLFGIEDMAGSLKDSFGLVKAGLGIGAGAVAGGVAGAVTGFGRGGSFSTVAGGLLGGAFRGAAGGAKGKVFEGAKTQIGRNKGVKETSLSGGSWWERQKAKVGLDSASMTDRKIKQLEGQQKAYEGFNKYKDDLDNIAESSDFMKDLRSMKTANGNNFYDEATLKNARTAWINNQLSGHAGGIVSFTDSHGASQSHNATQESGKIAGMQTILTRAESSRSGSSTISSAYGTAITNYAELEAANTATKTARNTVEEQINAAKSTDEYRAGEAARQGQGGNK